MTSFHGRPTVVELVEAVREFLETDVARATEGRVRFHNRVAVNVLAMVERELADDGAVASAHRERLEALGFADDTDLAAAIRAGDLDHRWDEVVDALAQSTRAKVAISNPKYLP